jgi:hypothetical protein
LNGSGTTLTNFYGNNRAADRGLVVKLQKTTGTTTSTVNVMVIDDWAALGWSTTTTTTTRYDESFVASHA